MKESKLKEWLLLKVQRNFTFAFTCVKFVVDKIIKKLFEGNKLKPWLSKQLFSMFRL